MVALCIQAQDGEDDDELHERAQTSEDHSAKVPRTRQYTQRKGEP